MFAGISSPAKANMVGAKSMLPVRAVERCFCPALLLRGSNIIKGTREDSSHG